MSVRLLIVLQWIVTRVPVGLGNWAADRIGDLISVVARRSRCAARSNMRHVLGPDAPERAVRRAARHVFRNVMRNYFDLFRLGSLSGADLDRVVDVAAEDLAIMRQVTAAGQGVLMVTPHWGAF